MNKPKFKNPEGSDKFTIEDIERECEEISHWKEIAEKAEIWAIEAHKATNHMYDTYLPYEHHLRMAVQFAKDFYWLFTEVEFWKLNAILWLHDTVEDCRKTYNDILKNFGEEIAEAVRAVTNITRGRNRDERMPDFVYSEIASIMLATAAKVCDRAANGQYSKMFGSSMFNKYIKENKHFRKLLLIESNERLTPMFDSLTEMFETPKVSFK